MTLDERRRAIIDATLPLLLERGPDLSTREIAQAAGVAEGTIFRAFDTKHDLIHATIHAAMRPDAAIAGIEHLPEGQPLAERIASVLDILRAELHRTRSLFMNVVRRDGAPPAPPAHGSRPWARLGGPLDNKALLLGAVTAALEAYSGELSVPVPVAATLLSALSFASLAVGEDAPLSKSAQLAEVVLHGIAKGDS
jgi:AcrR family transcriptional regulator